MPKKKLNLRAVLTKAVFSQFEEKEVRMYEAV
jgi:hypothetical protein